MLFRHSDKESLRATLKSDKLCSSDIEQVVRLVSRGRYSEACRAHHTSRVGLVIQSCDDGEKPIGYKVTSSLPFYTTHVSKYLIQIPAPEPNKNEHAIFTNPAQYFTSFVEEIHSDSEE